MTTALGEKIRKLRKEQKLTLEKLTELTESSKSYIWELENKNPLRPRRTSFPDSRRSSASRSSICSTKAKARRA